MPTGILVSRNISHVPEVIPKEDEQGIGSGLVMVPFNRFRSKMQSASGLKTQINCDWH